MPISFEQAKEFLDDPCNSHELINHYINLIDHRILNTVREYKNYGLSSFVVHVDMHGVPDCVQKQIVNLYRSLGWDVQESNKDVIYGCIITLRKPRRVYTRDRSNEDI